MREGSPECSTVTISEIPRCTRDDVPVELQKPVNTFLMLPLYNKNTIAN